MLRHRTRRIFVALALIAPALAGPVGCGIKGPLQAPPAKPAAADSAKPSSPAAEPTPTPSPAASDVLPARAPTGGTPAPDASGKP
jgi:predicted small lipoprotein YifL